MTAQRFLIWTAAIMLMVAATKLLALGAILLLQRSGCSGQGCGTLGLIIFVGGNFLGTLAFALLTGWVLMRRANHLSLPPIFVALAALVVAGAIEPFVISNFLLATRPPLLALTGDLVAVLLLCGQWLILALLPEARGPVSPALRRTLIVASCYTMALAAPVYGFVLRMLPGIGSASIPLTFGVKRVVAVGLPSEPLIAIAAAVTLGAQALLVVQARRGRVRVPAYIRATTPRSVI